MSLLSDIKQAKPFKSQKQKTVVNVYFTQNWIYTRQFKLLKSYGLSVQQYNVLRILRGQEKEPVTINMIIDRMLDKMSNASRLVDKLYLKGLVSRTTSPGDRRACDVAITQKGLELLIILDAKLEDWEKCLSDLSEEEFNQLNDLLDKLRNSTKD